MIASLIASGFAAGMGVTPESFHVTDIPALTVETGLKMGVIALGCAVVSIMFCIALNGAAGLYGRWFKNKYVRVAVGACLVIVVTFILRTDEYMGAGAELIEKAVENGQADTFAFFWKMVLLSALPALFMIVRIRLLLRHSQKNSISILFSKELTCFMYPV